MRFGVGFGKGQKKSRHFLTVTGNKEYIDILTNLASTDRINAL